MSSKILMHGDRVYCDSVAKSISEIIRYSLDENFRRNSYELFGVSSTNETEKEINRRLISILENKSDKRSFTNSNIPLKENEPTINNDSIPGTSAGSGSQRNFNENFLQISSENYRPSTKRIKLNCFSQPEMEISEHNDFQLKIPSSHSQPAPSSSSFLHDERTTLEDAGDQISQIFNKSFKNNVGKYLKKNFKTKI